MSQTETKTAQAPKSRALLRKLYPHVTGKQLEEVEENLDRYLDLIARIHRRIELDNKITETTESLTRLPANGTIQK